MRKVLTALALLAACAGCGTGESHSPWPFALDAITAVADARAPSDARTLRVSMTLGTSDPAIVRIYGWPPEQADQVSDQMAQSAGALGRWAMGPFASQPVMPGPHRLVELAAPVRAGWLYAAAIEPLSAQNGGTFDVPHVSMTFGKD